MSFRDFSFPQVATDLGLTVRQADLFSQVAPLTVRPHFAEWIDENLPLALGINNEKARSEFLVAPILVEVRYLLNRRFGIFSGVTLDVDPSRGLNGVCDFLITKSPMQLFVQAPLIAIAEAKIDLTQTGFGQCIAAMYAAQLFNEMKGTPLTAIYGASTTGTAWQFMTLQATTVTLDDREYYINDLGKLLAILKSIIESA
jgi:hypothetical protein